MAMAVIATPGPPAKVLADSPVARLGEASSPESVCQKDRIDDLDRGGDEKKAEMSLVVYLLGGLEASLCDCPISDWPNGRARSIFKYLVLNRKRPIPKEVLMDVFWPDADPDAARNNLNVAIYGLRRAFAEAGADLSLISFRNNHYALNPALKVWVDAEAFLSHAKAAQVLRGKGDWQGAARECHAAEVLFPVGPMGHERYEDWMIETRQRFLDAYAETLDFLGNYYLDEANYGACLSVSSRQIELDRCCEGPVQRMMRSLSRMGQRHAALQRYRNLREELAKELGITPTRETSQLAREIERGEQV
jgi:DNA-binding SARP family transcriptional activator